MKYTLEQDDLGAYLYIQPRGVEVQHTEEFFDDKIMVDFDAAGRIVGIEVLK